MIGFQLFRSAAAIAALLTTPLTAALQSTKVSATTTKASLLSLVDVIIQPYQSHLYTHSIYSSDTATLPLIRLNVDVVCGVVEVFAKLGGSADVAPSFALYDAQQTFSTGGVMTFPTSAVDRLCPNHSTCHLQITVFSWGTAQYSLTVGALQREMQAVPPLLEVGEFGITRDVLFGEYQHYHLWIPANTKTITIGVEVITGDPDVYLLLGPAISDDVSKGLHQYRSNQWGLVNESITLHAGDEYFCTSCYASIAVYGFEPSGFILKVEIGMEEDQVVAKTVSLGRSDQQGNPSATFILVLVFCSSALASVMYYYHGRIKGNLVHVLTYSRSTAATQQMTHSSAGDDYEATPTNASQSQYRAPQLDISREELMHYISLAEASESDAELSPFFRDSTEYERFLV